MRTFYAKSHWFWVISRIVFVLMFGVSIMQMKDEGLLREGDVMVVNVACIVGTLALAALAVVELSHGIKPTWLRYVGGAFLVLFAVGMLVVLAMGMLSGGAAIVLLVLIAWFLLTGVRDFLMR